MLTPALHAHIQSAVRNALAEDIGTGDRTAQLVPESQRVEAVVITRQEAVICGEPWFNEVLHQLDDQISVQWHVHEGQQIQADETICAVEGPARPILTAERTALNFLQLLSATATTARAYVDAVASTGVIILDTRKTIPGLRLAQKYAVRCGGATNHRVGLFDAILIKENHIVAAGGIGAAVTAARDQDADMLIEVEVENPTQLPEALAAAPDRLLLDNFAAAELVDAVELLNRTTPTIALEASGGVQLDNVRQIAETGIDFISVGALTKDLAAVDLSMRFRFAG